MSVRGRERGEGKVLRQRFYVCGKLKWGLSEVEALELTVSLTGGKPF